MPRFVDPVQMKNLSTEITVLSTSRVLSNVTLQSLTLSSGVKESAETGSTATPLVNYGLSFINATTAVATEKFTLAAPEIGVSKVIYCLTASSSDAATVHATTSVIFGEITTTNAYRTLRFTSPGVVSLLGITTARWAVLSIGSTVSGTSTLPTFTT